MHYYNEFDPNAAAWLRELIAQKLIPDGIVDERSITEIQPHELAGYTQCHFFAGIGGWPLALQLAGWDPARPVWTMSCPCQPFSDAGKGLAQLDERHLWPVAFRLIRECRPVAVFGEQVAAAIGKGWLDGISADLESENYACGAVVLGAHSVGAPHQRQRLYWVADTQDTDRRSELARGARGARGAAGPTPAGGPALRVGDTPGGGLGILGHAACPRSGGHPDGAGEFGGTMGDTALDGREVREPLHGEHDGPGLSQGCKPDGLAHPERNDRRADQPERRPQGRAADGGLGFWSDSRWIYCRDGKHRRIPTEPALFPLADGLPYKLARRGSIRPALLKGAGNAIVPEVAAGFIQAYRETLSE